MGSRQAPRSQRLAKIPRATADHAMSRHSKKRGNVPRVPRLTPEMIHTALTQGAKGAYELLRILAAEKWRGAQLHNLVLDWKEPS
jgi:hypothetical protein